MLGALAAGRSTPEQMANQAVNKLRTKMGALVLALDGRPDAHFRWMLSRLLRKLEALDKEVAEIDAQLDQQMSEQADLIERLSTIPGVDPYDGAGRDRRTRYGHERVSGCGASGQLGGTVSRQCGERGQTVFRENAQGRSLSAPHSGAKRVGGGAHQGLLSTRSVLPDWRETGAEEGSGCGGAPKPDHHLAHPPRRGRVEERGGDHFDGQDPQRTARKLTRRLQHIGFDVEIKRRPIDPVPPNQVVPADICGKCHGWRPGQCIHHNPRPKRQRSPRKPLEAES
jgi:hypothetical protein